MFISMDSGNSGSLQSSSGGDEEYDSSIRQDSSMVLHPQANTNFLHPSLDNISHFNPLPSTTNPQQQPSTSLLPHLQQPTLYDPSPSLFLAFSQTSPLPNPTPTSSLLNLEPPGLVTSNPNLGNLSTNIASLSSQSNLGAASNQGQGQGQPPLTTPQATSVRNPKKRTRASRRAPTTVLTTDTSNFRAMVQEFTGIPAPPFSASPYTRSRLDLFGSMGYNNLNNPLRPSPQKFMSPSNNNNSSSSSTSANTSTGNINTTFNISPPVGFQFGSTSDHLLNLQKPPLQPMVNMQNQMLSFQPFLQNPIPPTTTTHPLQPLGELGSLSQGLSSHFPSGNNTSWRDGGGSTEDNGNQRGRPCFDGSSSCKLNFSAAASNSDHFQHDKGLETTNVSSSRGEGTVDSWIYPSD